MTSELTWWETPRDPLSWRHYPSTWASISLRLKACPQKAHLGLLTDVIPSKVSHLFHTQTFSNWIVNLWWRLIIRPASEVLMRSYFSWVTSLQITPGYFGLWVLTCFAVFLSVARRIKLSYFSFPRLPYVLIHFRNVKSCKYSESYFSHSLTLIPIHPLNNHSRFGFQTTAFQHRTMWRFAAPGLIELKLISKTVNVNSYCPSTVSY